MKVLSLRLTTSLTYLFSILIILPFILRPLLTYRAVFPHERIQLLQEQIRAEKGLAQLKVKQDSKIALAYRISFSLLVHEIDGPDQASAAQATLNWDIQQIIERVFQPQVLEHLQDLANFSIDSQILYNAHLISDHAKLRGNPDIDIRELQGFLSANDFEANSLLENDRQHQLHFMLFAFPSHYPIRIKDGDKPVNSFVVPRWGGVVTFAKPDNCSFITATDLLPAFEIFTGQLLYLLGADGLGSFEKQVNDLGIQWFHHFIFSALDTASSLSRLTTEMTHMPILDRVSQRVNLALDCLEKAVEDKSLMYARFALQYAEEAFFDPSLVPQLYFPPDHLLGKLLNKDDQLRLPIAVVHMPLALPVLFPVLAAVFKETKRSATLLLERRKQKID